jgi:hypothetical protein
VSNDARVRGAATRRGARCLKCDEYVDGLMAPARAGGPGEPSPEKDESATPAEMAAWKAAFER